MTLADLDLPAMVRADAERFGEELGMREDVLIDHVLETYSPVDGDDHERAREWILAMIKAHADHEDGIEPV